jgi:hypothetical protein
MMPPTKANPIKEGSDEKKELIELFVSKEWTRMPGGRDDELEEMMKKYGWNIRTRCRSTSVFGIDLDLTRTRI